VLRVSRAMPEPPLPISHRPSVPSRPPGSPREPTILTGSTDRVSARTHERSGRYRTHAVNTRSQVITTAGTRSGHESARNRNDRGGPSRGRFRPQRHSQRARSFKLMVLATIIMTTAIAGVTLDTRNAATAGTSARLLVSTHADRAAAQALEDATLTGSNYIFVQPGASAIRRVTFTLDPGTARARKHTEWHSPFDFGGTLPTGLAMPLDPSTLAAGSHEMTAVIKFSNGRTRSLKANFNVPSSEGSTIPALPRPTATPSTATPTVSPSGTPSATTTPSATPQPSTVTPSPIRTTTPTPSATTTSRQPSSLTAAGPVVIDGKSGITIENLNITSSTGTCITIRNARDITVRNSNIGPCRLNAISVAGSSNVTIVDNYIHSEHRPAGCCDTNDGVFVTNSSSLLIQGNVIAFNESNVELNAASDVDIVGNYLLNPLGPFPRGQQVQSWNGGRNITVLDNYMRSSTDTNQYPFAADQADAINFGFTNGIRVQNNYVTGGRDPSGCGLLSDRAANNVQFLNNTLVRTGQCGIGIANGTDQVVDGNRIFNDTAIPGSGNVALYVWSQYPNSCGPVRVTNNLLYGVKPNGTPSSYWNGGGCGQVTYTGNIVDQAAQSRLNAMAAVLTPPAIPPKPYGCVAPAPYVNQSGWAPC
jgi:Right handed beta helix region